MTIGAAILAFVFFAVGWHVLAGLCLLVTIVGLMLGEW